MAFVGVTTHSTPPSSELKQLALLFDELAVPGLDLILDQPDSTLPEHHEAELQYLRAEKIIGNAEALVNTVQMNALLQAEPHFLAEPNCFSRLVAEQLRNYLHIDAVAIDNPIPLANRRYSFKQFDNTELFRGRALCKPCDLEQYVSTELYQAFADCRPPSDEFVISAPTSVKWQLDSGVVPLTQEIRHVAPNVAQIVLKQFPYISDATPWEAIKEFRADKELRGRRDRLRLWMRKIATSSSRGNEIEQELACLLAEYENHMRIHRMSINHGTLRTMVVGTAAILEDLVKIRFEKLAESLFSIETRRIELLKEELKAPGREVSYITRVNECFKDENTDGQFEDIDL